MPPAVPAAGPAAERPRRVLLVEDHHDTLRIMARVLKGLGYAVLTASTVAEALAAIEREDFDLLLSDIGLPDGTGLDVMRAVRLHPARNATRGVALSGFGHDDDIRRSREAGFEEHLVKPVSVQVLEGMLKRYTA